MHFQKAVAAHFPSKQLLPFGIADTEQQQDHVADFSDVEILQNILNQCWLNVDPPSATLDQREANIYSTSCVWWDASIKVGRGGPDW